MVSAGFPVVRVAVARRAVAGGARMVQVRSKPITARELYALTEAVAIYALVIGLLILFT